VGKRPALWAFATTSLLVISSAALHAQALAPSSLDLGSHDQKKADDMVQVITQKSAPTTPDKPIKAITKKRTPVTSRKPKPPVNKEPTQALAKESTQATTQKPPQAITQKPSRAAANDSGRTFAMEPVRPMGQQTVSHTTQPYSRFSFKTPGGKRESVPVITQYYPKQIVYPYGKIDRHIDTRLMQAASIAQERAHAHSRSRCWHYVKDALLASGVIDSRPKTELARDAAADLVGNYGFKRLNVSDPFSAPVGSVLVYGTARSVGHVELRTRDGFVSDFRSKTPSRRPLLGVYAKL
jgi:outer membrane biosynthesis protein TonB